MADLKCLGLSLKFFNTLWQTVKHCHAS